MNTIIIISNLYDFKYEVSLIQYNCMIFQTIIVRILTLPPNDVALGKTFFLFEFQFLLLENRDQMLIS